MMSQLQVINHNLVTVIKRPLYLTIKILGLKGFSTCKFIDFQSERVWFESCFCDVAYIYCDFVVFFSISLFLIMTFSTYFKVGVVGYFTLNGAIPLCPRNK